ncbi:hypothetical protein F2A31_11105 [Acinetobacter suaedae]|uniref:Uncharacterized protein n=1 Tax=Acinetobacter suaedae TaxID=2609668 RepID=A0A5P1UUK1_9GAMM|nr:hypothetical protein [Acinetobacter sp. C16S1]QER40224.1 hypothetical protein F2A31_11105 [Acinetobacter sp. C16S1]
MSRTRVSTKFFSTYTCCINEKYLSVRKNSSDSWNKPDFSGLIFSDKVKFFETKFKNKAFDRLMSAEYHYFENDPFFNIFLLNNLIGFRSVTTLFLTEVNKVVLKRRLFEFSESQFEDIIFFILLTKYDLISFMVERDRFVIKKIDDLEYYDLLQKYTFLVKDIVVRVDCSQIFEKYMMVFLKKVAATNFKFNLIFYDLQIMERFISNCLVMKVLGEEISFTNMLNLLGCFHNPN